MRSYRAVIIAVILLVSTSLIGYYLYRIETGRQSRLRETETQKLDPTASALSGAGAGNLSVNMFLYKSGFIDSEEKFLLKEQRTIVETGDAVLNARQIITEALAQGSGFPSGIKLRQVYLLDDGTAVVDLSANIAQEVRGGVASEFGMIMSITRSLRANVTQVKRVRFLVEGESRATLAGHVSIRDPFM